MKNLQTTTTGSLFNHTGILTHAGDYAGKFTDEADMLLESVSDKRDEIYVQDGSSYGWSDIMFNERTGELYAVWANGALTEQSALLQYAELDEADCPKAFAEAKAKVEIEATTYNITKSYEGFASKNRTVETGLSLEDANNYLNSTERSWKRNGGLIISKTETTLVVEESDESNTITFEIEEVEEYKGI